MGVCVSNTRVNFRLPKDLIREADAVAKANYKNRTQIIKEALQNYLEEIESKEEFKEKVIDLYLDDEIDIDALKDVIGRQNAESVKASKQILSEGEEMAEELSKM